MNGQPTSLLEDFPSLLRLRSIESWWDLFDVVSPEDLDRTECARGLAVLIGIDDGWDDKPSSQAHRTFRDIVLRALDEGVEVAMKLHTDELRRQAPPDLQPGLQRIDLAVLDYTATRNVDSIRAAEKEWVHIATSSGIDNLALPLRVSLTCDAVLLHMEVFNRIQDPEALDRVIGLLDAAMVLMRQFDAHPPACRLHLDPRLQTLSRHLASALRTRFARNSSQADLNKSIGIGESLLQLTHPWSPDYPLVLAGYAITMGYFGEEGLEKASQALETAIDIEPHGSALRMRLVRMLGRGYLSEYKTSSDPAALEDAIECLTDVADGSGPQDYSRHNELSEAYFLRAANSGSEEDIQAALGLLQQLYPDTKLCIDAQDSTAMQILLSIAPILPTESAADLIDAALDTVERVGADGETETAEKCAELVALLRNRSDGWKYARETDLAIRLLEIATHLDTDARRRSRRLGELAECHLARFDLLGDKKDIGAAIDFADRSVGDLDETDSEYPDRLQSLGVLLIKRFEVAGVLADLYQAIELFESALVQGARDDKELNDERFSAYKGNLALALRMRSEIQDNRSDLDVAIKMLELVLQAAERIGNIEAIGQALNNLGATYHDRWRRHNDKSDLDKALQTWGRAVKGNKSFGFLPLVRQNIVTALIDRYKRDSNPADLDLVIDELPHVLKELGEFTSDRAYAEGTLACAFGLRWEKTGQSDDLEGCIKWGRAAVIRAREVSAETLFNVASDTAGRAARHSQWDEAAAAYVDALRAFRRLFENNLTRQDKETWLNQSFGLPTRAAYSLVRTGSAADAVTALEWGRGLLISEIVGTSVVDRIADGQQQNIEELETYVAAMRKWRKLAQRANTATTRDALPTVFEVETAQHAVWKSVHDLDSVGVDIFAPPTFKDVREAARQLLVYFVPGFESGLGILVDETSEIPQVVQLEQLGEKSVGRQTRAYMKAYSRLLDDADGWEKALDRITKWLGEALAPAVAAMDGRRCVFIPTGALALLPLHAAWVSDSDTPTGRRYLLDHGVISYAPTALSLHKAMRRPSSLKAPSSLLAVFNPQPSGQLPLDYAKVETKRSASFVETVKELHDTAASVEGVVEALPSCDVVHFACHASSNMLCPRKSGIFLAGDRQLTVDAFVSMDMANTKLAILSACETGVSGQEAPDELINIGTALFSAGVDGVLSSLWPVLDESTLLLTARFYELWFGVAGDRFDAGAALVLAQRWLRDTTNSEKQEHWDELRNRDLIPESTYKVINSLLAERPGNELSFSSLDCWAPFTLTGSW